MQINRRRILLFGVILLLAQSVYPQQIIPRFEQLGVNDGLPHSSVYSITQDKKGFMWFGTPDGLCRYDGSELISYKYIAKDNRDVINNFVRGKMQEDNAGNIWYSNESGIYKWDQQKEKVLKVRPFKKNEFANVAFQVVMLDQNGSLWMFNVVAGLFEFDIFSGKLTQYRLPENINRSDVQFSYNSVDLAGNVWLRIVSGNEPYLTFNRTSHLYSIQPSNDPPHALFFGKDNDVQAFEDRLVYKDLKTKQTHTVIKQINNKKILFYSYDGIRDNYGRLWMTARGNGLFYYDEQQSRFQQYRHNNSKIKSLPFDLTTCLYIDRGENLWIGIDGGGVAKLDLKQPRFNLFPLSEGDHPILNDYFTKCFYEDEKERIWFGSHTNGLNILDNQQNTLTNYHHKKNDPQSIPGNIVGSILKDREGNIWIGSSGGISLFDEKKGTFKTISIPNLPRLHPEMNIFVFRMIQLQNGDLLAATLNGLVKVIKQANGQYEGKHFGNVSFLISTTTDIVELPGGTIYATIPGLGLYELEPGKTAYTLSNIYLDGIDLRSVRLDETNTGYLWVSTGIGLIHFDTRSKTFETWNEQSGLANSYVYGSLEDEKHNIWISTNGGLSYLNRRTNHIANYSFKDGLQSNEFNTQAFYKSSTNTFYFGGIKGFNWFQTKTFSNEHQYPQAAITKIEVDNTVLEKDAALWHVYRPLPHDSNNLNFKFAALDFTRPEANIIQYKLQGWDAKWITTDARSARYANLPPGNYTMLLKASNAEGFWSKEESIRLTILAPFWRQLWFIAMVISMLLLAIIYITWRLSHLKAKRKLQLLEKQIAVNAERNRISADMHDEIGSGITHIALLSELIQTQQKNEAEIKKDVQIISTSARSLVQTMGENIWAMNPQNDTLENLLAYTRERSQQYFEPFEMELCICFPDDVPTIKLTNEKRRNLYLVTKELLSNAMKHSGANKVNLNVGFTESICCFTITDNGIGMNEENIKPHNNGVKNLKKRMQDIGGSIEWLSEGEGTTVKYCLPV